MQQCYDGREVGRYKVRNIIQHDEVEINVVGIPKCEKMVAVARLSGNVHSRSNLRMLKGMEEI